MSSRDGLSARIAATYHRSVTVALLLSLGLAQAGSAQDARRPSSRPQASRLEVAVSREPITIDGDPSDPFWGDVGSQTLVPAGPGVPAALGGSFQVGLAGSHLCLAARLPEPGGKIVARSIGRNPVWERDAPGSPPVEDRLRFQMAYRTASGEMAKLTITIGPFGAYRVEKNGRTLNTPSVQVAAKVNRQGWTIEASLPLKLLAGSGGTLPSALRLQVVRIRSRRPLAPEFRWSWPRLGPGEEADSERMVLVVLPSRDSIPPESNPPRFRPPLLGNKEPPLEVGRVARLPELRADWDDPAWREAADFGLARNEPYPRAPRYETRVKWMHDGRSLALLLRMTEPDPVVANRGGRDARLASDDHMAIYLATSGSALAEIVFNPAGALRDAIVKGPHRKRASAGWNADIGVRTELDHGGWTAQVHIPLDQVAEALGEPAGEPAGDGTAVPSRWRVLLVRRRAARPGEAAEVSALPVVVAHSFHRPARYRRMVLSDLPPGQVRASGVAFRRPPLTGLAKELSVLDSHVWSPAYRRYHGVRSMVARQQRRRIREAVWRERRAWRKVHSRADWERFRDLRVKALRESVGRFPPPRPPLDVHVTARREGDGYRLENLAFQSRPGFYIAANLYLPAKALKTAAGKKMPGMVIVPSQHYPKTQGELHDMGELWARGGAAVLIMERPGYGERAETSTAYRQGIGSRFTFTKQLFLAGESYSGWVAWDIIRSVDLLKERPDIGPVIVLGSVAGGGEPAGVAAALDERIAAVVPFNYDQGHVRVHGDSPGQIAKQFSPWLVAASVAPRRFVRAFEFGWEGAEQADYPELWVDGFKRSQKVWGFYNALDHLASSHAYGLIRLSMERVSHCYSIGPQQRAPLYAIFKRWFGLPLPEARDLAILPDSGLSVNPLREEARKQEAARRRPHHELLSITPELSARLPRRKLHEIARDLGARQLRAAREARSALAPAERLSRLRSDLEARLGDIAPVLQARAETSWQRSLSSADVEAISLRVEDGIEVPLLWIRPKTPGPAPVVVAVAQGGKERFLSDRAPAIRKLIEAGVSVCLPDVRGTGETSPSPDRADRDGSAAEHEFDLGGSMLGARLKDLRTVLAYLRTRSEVRAGRIALWGDSFAPPNRADLISGEVEPGGGPEVQYRAEPLGAHLALLAGLYEQDLRAVAASRGLAGYLHVLDDAITYTPMDVIVHGILQAGDIADMAAAIAPRPLLLEGMVDGRNVRLEPPRLERTLQPARRAYDARQASDRLVIRSEPGDAAAWLAEILR